MEADYNEERVIRAAQAGDREAFASLYEAHVDRVYHYLLRRMGQPADAEDVTAEVFIRAMKALKSFEFRGAPFVAWLLRIAHNTAVNHMKKQSRRQEIPLLDNLPSANDPAELALNQVASEEVSRAMQGLTALQRQVITLSRDSPDQTNFPGYSSRGDTAKYNPAFQGRQMRPDAA